MRVLFLVPHPIEGPSSRFRVYQYLPYLAANGINATVRPFINSRLSSIIYTDGNLAAKLGIVAAATAGRVGDLLKSFNYDVVYVLREAFPFGPPLFEYCFRKFSGRLIFDFDDAIYMRSLAFHNPLDRFRDWQKPAKVIATSTHVVVGSVHLRNYARRYIHDEAVSVIPTVVDTTQYAVVPFRQTDRVTIGWIGTPRGSCYLFDLLDVFNALAKRFPAIAFKFVGALPFEVGALPVQFKDWRLDEEIADIQSFDIGIMPLTDDEETRGKCGFKLIQYLGAGVPAVCSPIGANCDIVEHAQSGFFAQNAAQWEEALATLIDDEALRRRFGAHGRARVESHYSLIIAAPKMLDVLHRVADAKL